MIARKIIRPAKQEVLYKSPKSISAAIICIADNAIAGMRLSIAMQGAQKELDVVASFLLVINLSRDGEAC